MRSRRWRGPARLVAAAVFVLAAPIAAEAATPPGLLSGEDALGEVSDVEGSTKQVTTAGPCPSETHPDGYDHAAIYRATASAHSLLRIDVEDDSGDSLSLCSVAIYEVDADASQPPGGEPLTESTECAASSTCAIERWLADGKTYMVVLWASPPLPGPGADDAAFVFDASIKRSASIATTVAGHRIRDACTGYHEVLAGTAFTVTTTTSSASTGTIEVSVHRRESDGSWQPYASYDRPLTDGVALLSLTAGASGTFRFTTLLPEEPTRLGATKTVYIVHVTPKWVRYADGGVRLKVPWYHQQLRLSCEAATLRMAHNYFKAGSIDRDWDVLKVIGVDYRKKKGNRWGNPNKVFVGRPTGTMMRTGYGVHYGPVARAATTYSPCRPAVTLKNYSRATIARYVAMGFPVIVWGAHAGAGGINKHRWKAWDGQWITAWSVEHVWVIVGFHGSASKPQSFIVHDPSGGARQKVSLRQFDAFTKYFRRAVVVRG